MAGAYQLYQYTGEWTEIQLRHLLIRTLFGVSHADLDFFNGKSMDECVELLLRPIPLPSPPKSTFPEVPDSPDGISFVYAPYDETINKPRTFLLQSWWAGLMKFPQGNITEKMVLFWHNHFAIELFKVGDVRYNYHYLNLLRKHAIGNFKILVREITKDPSMLVYLNGNSNNKDTPNENYGRELQELFTIGRGPNSHYTESDVKAAAKVLTGWKDNQKNIGSYFDEASHNTADKTFSPFYDNHTIKGRSGNEGAKETDELIEMIFRNKEVSKFICRKLYRWFVHSKIDEQVEENVISPLSKIMIENDYEIKPVLKFLFTSTFFYDPHLIGGIFKSPIDYFIGIVREFNFSEDHFNHEVNLTYYTIRSAMYDLGQSIGEPPGVTGWPAYYEYPFYDRIWTKTPGYFYRDNSLKTFILRCPYLQFDFIDFVSRLSNPSDPKALITDSLNFLCCIKPGAIRITTFQEQLNGEHNKGQQAWAELWAAYTANPSDEKVCEEVNGRLSKVFCAIFTIPEYQIM